MQSIPRDLFFEILEHLDISDIIKYCSTNSRFNSYCRETNLWSRLFQRDYPGFETTNAQQDYLNLFRKNTRLIPIYVNDVCVTDLWIDNTDTYKTIISKLQEIWTPLNRSQLILEFKSGDTVIGSGLLYHMMLMRPSSEPITSVYIYDTLKKYDIFTGWGWLHD